MVSFYVSVDIPDIMKAKIFDTLKRRYSKSFVDTLKRSYSKSFENNSNISPLISAADNITKQAR